VNIKMWHCSEGVVHSFAEWMFLLFYHYSWASKVRIRVTVNVRFSFSGRIMGACLRRSEWNSMWVSHV